jgi:hypothetical protein
VPGPDTVIPLFEQEHVYFVGGDNRRSVDVEVVFPEADLAYEQITLEFTLGCPDGGCDWWDRKGYLGVVREPGTEDESVTEILRFITPYRVGGSWSIDVTALRPLLADNATVRVFIDTWVGPGHQNGAGWLVDATLDYRGGILDPRPVAVIPFWDEMGFVSGDPARPIAESVLPSTVSIPEGATKVELRSLITGHGQGNAENCAEFCQKVHGYSVGGTGYQRTVWRDDCAETGVPGQQGTWTYPRAGWCPGADVIPWVEDVTEAVTPGADVTVTYHVSDYENTCRPDAPICTGCTLGTGCEYNGGSHTEPHYRMSALLVAYR